MRHSDPRLRTADACQSTESQVCAAGSWTDCGADFLLGDTKSTDDPGLFDPRTMVIPAVAWQAIVALRKLLLEFMTPVDPGGAEVFGELQLCGADPDSVGFILITSIGYGEFLVHGLDAAGDLVEFLFDADELRVFLLAVPREYPRPAQAGGRAVHGATGVTARPIGTHHDRRVPVGAGAAV